MQTTLQVLPAQQAQNPLSIREKFLKGPKELSPVIADRMGLESDRVDLIVRSALGENIAAARKVNFKQLVAAIGVELEFAAKAYTGCTEVNGDVFQEMTEFVFLKFSHLGVMEIREAFRLAAAKEIAADLSAYYGFFTIKALGDVLRAYNLYRNKVVAEMQQIESAAVEQHVLQLNKKVWNSEEWAWCRASFFGSREVIEVDHVSVADYNYFVEPVVKQIPEDERREDWQKAWDLSIADVQAGIGRGEVGMSELLRKVQAGGFDEGFRDKRLNYYKRLLTIRWIQSLKS